MPVIQCLCGFALKGLSLDGADVVVSALSDRVSDQSRRLTNALMRANRRAWGALEVTLAGPGFWNRFDRAEDRALRQQIQGFLNAMPLPELEGKEHYRQHCLKDLRTARGKGLLLGHVVAEDLAQRAGAFARLSDARAILDAERKALREMVVELHQAGFKALAWLLNQQAHPGQSLIVVSVRYFFRREVESDAQLARGLQFEAMENLTQSQQASFRSLEQALEQQGQRIEQALTDLLTVAAQTRDEVAGMRSEAKDQHAQILEQMQGLQTQMQQVLEHLHMKNQPVQARHSLSIRDDRERQMVKELLGRYRSLPEAERRTAPELLNDVGKLQVAVGDFDGAQTSFIQAATLAPDRRAQAEAHHNAYQAALERDDSRAALDELKKAVALDPARFAPFPLEEYEPERILGAGGFGVTFLCRLQLTGAQVAVKALTVEGLELDVGTVLREAATLDQLNHPAIIRLRHCGYADAEHTRPYLVMEYFEGDTLEAFVRQRGSLPVGAVLPLAMQIAEALQAAHGQGILHRDVKPANILVRWSAPRWEVRLIDFGLALKQNILEKATSTLRQSKTVVGTSIAGTLDYAAPEQLGKLPGVRVGPAADVYGFAKTFCFALFQNTEPTFQDWQKIPTPLAELLGRCLSRGPEQRPQSFAEVVRALSALSAPPPVPKQVPELQLAPIELEDEPPLAQIVPETRSRPGPPPPPPSRSGGLRFDPPRSSALPFRTTTGKRIADAILAFWLGILGAHKFSQGNTGAGWVRILISCTCIGLYVTWPVGIIEAILYAVKSNEEYDQLYLIEKKPWF
jgi:serine/threonine protein kinase